ncbi:cell division protein CrgA [Nocardioides sp. STR2]|uniref:Cell division protein CrgA n=1 Tax=Nocardioides pini TaxID=2975053 RepID=A0ABT4CGQ0_9ACTN|nr:cell division protein CrgA [Nocardioides pini]MCY4728115.1 cell division protein CrgA [Nocardioides pini]
MSKSTTITSAEKTSLFTPRFVIALVLILAGIGWLVFYYVQARGNPLAFPPVEGTPKAVADLGDWNYLIGFGLLMVGLMVSAHPSTPLGRGRGVVVAMLACFLIGLLWICTFYVFSDDLSKLPIFNDLGQWNLVVGIAFMAVGFSFATKWE